MKRRDILGVAGLLVGGCAAGTAAGIGPLASDTTSGPVYLEEESIVYEREPLQLRAPTDTVRHGESIAFEYHHTGESEEISLGCNVPWAIQSYEDGTWKHVVWTDQRWLDMCYSGITPGNTGTITITLSETAIADHQDISEDEAEVAFKPGKYRFVLVGTNPPLAVNFRILPAE